MRRIDTSSTFLLKAVFSSMTEGLIAVDGNMTIILMNQAAGILLRTAPRDAVNRSIGDIFRLFKEKTEKENKLPALLKKALNKPDIITLKLDDNFYCRAGDEGKKFPISIVIVSLLNHDGIIGALVVFKDISQEKEIDRAKTEFVSLASHQLQTPLVAINWYTEVVLSGGLGKLNKKQKEYMEEIYGSVQRMKDLINLLLNVSRIELGVIIIEPEPVDILEIAESVLKELSHQIQAKKIRLIKRYEKKLPLINVDPRLMRMVFQNLFSNAIKYNQPEGMIEIDVLREGSNVLSKVKDNGCGIPPKEQAGIFTKLFRASNAMEKESEGNGLGLYVIKSLLEQAGGKIWFSSGGVNKGSAFFFSIPLKGMERKRG